MAWMKWDSLVIIAPVFFAVLYWYARRRKLTKKLASRTFFHGETYWTNYYAYDSVKIMAALTDLSDLIDIPFTLIDPTDKLPELTLSDALNSDKLDDVAILLRDKYKVDEKALRHVLTVDDYIRAALNHGVNDTSSGQ